MTSINFANTFPIAKKHYACNGCGEVPIEPGVLYMRSKMMNDNGQFTIKRYCIRCTWAIKASIERPGGHEKKVKDGDLQWCKLASPFRKAWTKLASGVATEEGFETAKKEFLDGIGIQSPEKGAISMEQAEKKKEQHAKRILRKDAKELKQEKKKTENFKSDILAKLNSIKTEMLRLKVLHLNSDSDYVEKHAEVVKKMLELEQFIQTKGE